MNDCFMSLKKKCGETSSGIRCGGIVEILVIAGMLGSFLVASIGAIHIFESDVAKKYKKNEVIKILDIDKDGKLSESEIKTFFDKTGIISNYKISDYKDILDNFSKKDYEKFLSNYE